MRLLLSWPHLHQVIPPRRDARQVPESIRCGDANGVRTRLDCRSRLDPSRLTSICRGEAAFMPQITAYLSPDVKAQFHAYAGRIGIDVSGLVKLLIVRERRLERLKLCVNDIVSPLRRRKRGEGVPLDKITAHLPEPEAVREFDLYAHSLGLNRDAAAAQLIRRELEERWLEAALSAEFQP